MSWLCNGLACMHMVLLKSNEQKVNNQSPTQFSQFYVHVFVCLNQVMFKYAHWWS